MANAPADLALELLAIEKSFGGVRALRGAELRARRGEILGLCGENGAGKSTLLKVLAGIHPRSSYAGTTKVFGKEERFETTRDAERAGVAIVHQELALVPELSVAANLALGHEPPGPWGFPLWLDDEAIELSARTLLAQFGVEREIDARAHVATLGIGLQQIVEIVRALSRDAKVLVLDEPTAALTAREAERLMTWLRELRAKGTTCLYVSHRIDEVFALCDRVTVLRDGKTVGTVEIASTTPDEVVEMMVGRSIARARERTASHAQGDARLEVRGLSVPHRIARRDEDGTHTHAVRDVSFVAKRGEVIAIAGAMGSGRTALLSALFGCARHGFTGSVRVDGADVALPSPRAAIDAGLALVPEDRKGSGLVLGLGVGDNLALAPRGRIATFLSRLGFVDDEADELAARQRIDELRIRGDAASEVTTLSGGNQQKVVIGKWLASPPRVLLLDEPTRGVDVGAREEIYGILERLTKDGAAIVLASSDLVEVLRLADRRARAASRRDRRRARCPRHDRGRHRGAHDGSGGMTDAKKLVAQSRSLRIVFVLLAMWLLLALHPETREAFLSAGNFSNLTAQIAEIVIAGVGMTLVILIGGIDLSVGAGMALAGVLAAKLQIDMQKPAWMAVLAAVAACGTLGAWHGILVTRFAIPPFIATLSGFLAYRGLALVVSDARGLSPMGEDFQRLGDRVSGNGAIACSVVAAAIGVALVLHREQRRKKLALPTDGPAALGLRLFAIAAATGAAIVVYRGGMPVPVAIAAVCSAIGAVVLGRTRLGRYAYAIGGNAEAARLSGVPVRSVTIAIYVAMGALTGLAGIVATARTNGVTPGNAGLMRELHVITAVVIGGTSLTGGRGTILGTIIGALVFGTLSNGMNLMGVNSNWQLIATGLILLAASVVDAWSSRPRT